MTDSDDRGQNNGNSMNAVQENCTAAVVKSLTPTLSGEDKNKIDPVQLNELLLSVID